MPIGVGEARVAIVVNECIGLYAFKRLLSFLRASDVLEMMLGQTGEF